MRMNNKGFTLVEILAVLVLLSILSGVAIMGVLSSIETSKKVTYDTLVDNIKSGAQSLYQEVENNNLLSSESKIYKYGTDGSVNGEVSISGSSIIINLQTLINNGYLTGINNDCTGTGCNNKLITNPKNNKDIGSCIIKITKSGESYIITNESTSNSDCPSSADYSSNLADNYDTGSHGSSGSDDSGQSSESEYGAIEVGDYISYKSTASTYSLSKDVTGYTSSQTIKPNELTLWRVISVDNNAITIISEHTSSSSVCFKGTTGYKNLVGGLNILASQYVNSTYAIGSRYFGYSNQTENISSLQTKTCSISSTKTACNVSTGDDTTESGGGGDTGYLSDYNLVFNVLGGLVANGVATGSPSNYWVASRYYTYHRQKVSSTNSAYYYYYYRSGRSIGNTGELTSSYLYAYMYTSNASYYSCRFSSSGSSCSTSEQVCKYLRPIVYLKPSLKCDGSGTLSSPCALVDG